MGKDADGDGEGGDSSGWGLVEAGQKKLPGAAGQGLPSQGLRNLQGLLTPAPWDLTEEEEEEEGKHRHLSARGRWNLQLTA